MMRFKLFCFVYQIQIFSPQRSFMCEFISHPFWFKIGLSVLNMILETLTSFDSVFRDIGRSIIDSAIDFDDTSGLNH